MNSKSGGARNGPSRRQAILNGAIVLAGLAAGRAVDARAGAEDGITRTGEAIHQEVVFKASRKRIYEALTSAAEFEKVTRLGGAIQSGMSLGSKPTEISREEGGAFTLFRGHIVGRQIELVANERIVQAWRVVDWDRGQYSVARFELRDEGTVTKLVFDHTGFPKGLAEHLAMGWKGNYWEPLEKFLAG